MRALVGDVEPYGKEKEYVIESRDRRFRLVWFRVERSWGSGKERDRRLGYCVKD